jgi:hypothetical protein
MAQNTVSSKQGSVSQLRQEAQAARVSAQQKEKEFLDMERMQRQLEERDRQLWYATNHQSKPISSLVGIKDPVTGIPMSRFFIRHAVDRHKRLQRLRAIPSANSMPLNTTNAGGRPVIITASIAEQVLRDFTTSPEICEGALNSTAINRLMVQATKTVTGMEVEPYSMYIVNQFIIDYNMEELRSLKTRNARDMAAMNDIANNVSQAVVASTILSNDNRDPRLMFNLDATTQYIDGDSNQPVFAMPGTKESMKKMNRSGTRRKSTSEF